MQIKSERGYLIPAVNTESVNYERCAQNLAASIRSWHPHADVTVLTRDMMPFDSQPGYANDWQVFWASPYRQTIKLEADMLAAGPIDHWWTLFEHRDVVISQGCRDYHDRISSSRAYRKIFDDNDLPDVYNAVTYWRVSETAQKFFQMVRLIFQNWADFRGLLKFPDEQPTTDVVYAMAAKIIGPELVTLPPDLGPQIVHMKRHVIGTKTDDWTKELVWERIDNEIRVQTISQWGWFHYHVKDWA